MRRSSPAAGLLAAAALLCAGCETAPRYYEPLAGLGTAPQATSAQGAFKDLSVAVYLSQNTRQTVEQIKKFNSPGPLGLSDVRIDLRLVDEYVSAIQGNFGSVFRVEGLPQAQASGADLVAVLDVYLTIPGTAWNQAACKANAIFLSTDGRQVASIAAETAHKGFMPIDTKCDKLLKETRRKLESAILASPELQSFAREKASAPRRPPEPSGAPPAPAPRVLASAVDSPAYQRPERPDDFALVVGIEKYAALPDAEFAERDAAAVRRHLQALGYPGRNIVYLAGSQALGSAMGKYIESWFPRNVKEDSRLFVYFSGHGAPDPRTGAAYLVPWDGDAKFLEQTGYPVQRLYERLAAIKAREVVVVLDACFSGAGGRSVLAKGMRPLVARVDVGGSVPDKLAVLAASSSDEVTGTKEAEGHGLFTYYLLKGLNETKGEATLQRLYDYLLPKVQEEARRENRDQTPRLTPPAPRARTPL